MHTDARPVEPNSGPPPTPGHLHCSHRDLAPFATPSLYSLFRLKVYSDASPKIYQCRRPLAPSLAFADVTGTKWRMPATATAQFTLWKPQRPPPAHPLIPSPISHMYKLSLQSTGHLLHSQIGRRLARRPAAPTVALLLGPTARPQRAHLRHQDLHLARHLVLAL